MIITHPREPASGRSILRAHIAEILARPGLAHADLAGAPSASLEVAQPQRTYTMSLADVRAQRSLASLQPDGWRYLVFAGPRAVAAVELATIVAPPHVRFAHVNSGRVVRASARALRLAETLSGPPGLQYEARLLRAPELLFVALWLHGARDVVLQLSPHGTKLEVEAPHDAADVLGALRAKLQARGG